MANILVVTNYNAGRKQALKNKKTVQKFLLKNDFKFKFITVDEFADADIKKFNAIFVMGGDGTVNKVARKLADSDKPMLILPCGTANLLSSKLNISQDLNKALELYRKNDIQKIDVMSINGNSSILRCGFGYDADIITKTPQSLKNKFGYFAYFIAGIIFALRLKQKRYELILDGGQITTDATCLIIANSSNMYRNFISVGNNSALNDGIFEVFILKAKNPITFFFEFLRISFGIKKNNPRAQYLKGKNLQIKNKLTTCHIDGEKIKLQGDINISINKNISVLKN